MAGILTITALANPLGLLPWIERGRKVWAIISNAATLYTVGSALHVLVGSEPGDTGAKMKATPSIYDDHPNYQSPTVQSSTVLHGVAYGDYLTELSDDSAAGNYADFSYNYHWVNWDEDAEEYVGDIQTGVMSGDWWVNKAGWDWLLSHDKAAQQGLVGWSRGGYWVYFGGSTKYEYPDVPLESRISNPSWWSSKIDGELQAKAKELGYTYDAKLHADLIKLAWVAGKDGLGGHSGHWTEGATVKHFAPWNDVKGYEDDFTTINSKDICLKNHKMKNLRGCRGGIKIWWEEIVEDKRTTVLNQAIDANGVRTGPITTNSVVLPHHKWVTRHEKESTDRSAWWNIGF